jgi:hypothetical protein
LPGFFSRAWRWPSPGRAAMASGSDDLASGRTAAAPFCRLVDAAEAEWPGRGRRRLSAFNSGGTAVGYFAA